MRAFLSVLLDSALDSLKVLPVLLIVYLLIEFIEYRFARKLQSKQVLNGKFGPLIGSLVGSVPQCGFSVVASDLYSRKAISVGTLIAVFIATSDEAVPIFFANPFAYKSLAILIVSKIVLGVAFGYLADLLFKPILKKESKQEYLKSKHITEHNDNVNKNKKTSVVNKVVIVDNKQTGANCENALDKEKEVVHHGCCKHDVEGGSFDVWHPIFHSLKILLFVFVVNLVFGIITKLWIGEDRLLKFLTNVVWLQPILCVVVGIVPNCASSVVLTQLYLLGGLNFSSLLAGLMVNAGMGVVLLLKQNKNAKQNVFIIFLLILFALLIGYLFSWLVI